jgi:hypothetical protein
VGSAGSLAHGTAATVAAVAVQREHLDRSAHGRHESPPTQTSEAATLAISDSCGHRLGTINFENDGPQERRLSPTQRIALCDDIAREIARLEQWSVANGWPHASPQLDVIVGDRYRISKSLVPAWNRQVGRMEVPARRAVTGKAAIMHELVHVFFPSANRFLAEGLAIYLQAAIGGNPAFPNFGRPLHVVAREVLRDMVPDDDAGMSEPFDAMKLADLDAIATPAPLTLRVGSNFYGEEPHGQARIYPLAGSFTQHLVEAHGLQRFHAIYSQTPLVPLEQSAGAGDRWLSAYGRPLAELEREWKAMIAGHEPAAQRSESPDS